MANALDLAARSFSVDHANFLLDGKPFQIFSGEMHYFRVPREYWRHRLQSLRAMGLNTVCTYMPWNLHEPTPGQFDFTGMLDVAAYIKMAQEEGLYVLLRPGPYICAEWNFGGFPAWLLATPDIRLRCHDPRYLAAVDRYLLRVGQECAALQYQRGGPIILVQVENEYGAFGNDRVYLEWMVDANRRAGFDCQLFVCDWAYEGNMKAGKVDNTITVANFGSNAEEQITNLRYWRPNQPAMCGEFWCGWFDHWGAKRSGSMDFKQAAIDLQWMIENNASFNLYMAHGGTSFGFMAGANCREAYAPTVSSYDYWSALDESGRPTSKFHTIREIIQKYSRQAEKFPELPEPPFPIVRVPEFKLTESAALLENLPKPVREPQTKTMEQLGQSYGLILYRTDVSGLGNHKLRVVHPHDYAKVYLNGKLIATFDRRLHEDSVKLEGVTTNDGQLDILVDTMGRVNFGSQMADRKGITDRVEYGEFTLMGWDIFSLPLDEAHLASLKWHAEDCAGPAFHRGQFHLETVGDTFLDLRKWHRGMVWINGHALGRFWHIGPQQTLYVPGAWLRRGVNDVVVFDLEGSGRQSLAGLDAPILDDVPVAEEKK